MKEELKGVQKSKRTFDQDGYKKWHSGSFEAKWKEIITYSRLSHSTVAHVFNNLLK